MDAGKIQLVRISGVAGFLKHEQKFARLSSVTGVDRLPAVPRFEVVYHLHSAERNERLRLKCRLGEESPQSILVTGVWRGAGWYENGKGELPRTLPSVNFFHVIGDSGQKQEPDNLITWLQAWQASSPLPRYRCYRRELWRRADLNSAKG